MGSISSSWIAMVKEELDIGRSGDEALHPWRYSGDNEDAGIPFTKVTSSTPAIEAPRGAEDDPLVEKRARRVGVLLTCSGRYDGAVRRI